MNRTELYYWLIQNGYFPENYILPPCFIVSKHPKKAKLFFKLKGKKYTPKRTEYVKVHFPKSELTDRTFGIINPEIHNDIAFHISKNWQTIQLVAKWYLSKKSNFGHMKFFYKPKIQVYL